MRKSKVEQLRFLSQTKEAKKLVLEAAEEIFAAESDEQACRLAEKYRNRLCPFLIADIADVFAIILKGGQVVQCVRTPKDISYLVFIPVPDPPNKKTLVGHITKKQFRGLCSKGFITERSCLQHTDDRGYRYFHYQLSEEMISIIRTGFVEQKKSLGNECMTVKELRSMTGLSQSRFAFLFSLPVRTLQQWEQGIQKPPDYVVGMMKRILELTPIAGDVEKK